MSNKKPELVECRIKSFESRADESLWVTLDVPLTIARFMTKAASDGIPLRILVEAVPAVPAQGASASNETTIKVTATPEWLAEQAVRAENHAITLIKPSGTWIAEIGHAAVNCPRGEELAAIRAWLAGLIREGYEAGVESVAQTKADDAEAKKMGGHLNAAQARIDELNTTVTNLRVERDRLADSLSILRTERDDLALQRERTEGQRCHLALMLGLDGGASWEDVAPAVAASQAKAREEGRRQGLRQAADRVQRYLAETQEIGVECDEQIEALREGIKSKEDIRRSIAQKAEAYRTALADLKKQIDKEPA